MTKHIASTRRMFLRGGALLAAPIAAVGVSAMALGGEDSRLRVSRLENEAAIRALHQSWLRQVNAGEREALPGKAVRRITVDHAGAPEKIEIAADGRSAVGYFDYAVELERPLARDSTLAQMAHVQGNGSVRLTQRRLLSFNYTRTSGAWKIDKVAFKPQV